MKIGDKCYNRGAYVKAERWFRTGLYNRKIMQGL